MEDIVVDVPDHTPPPSPTGEPQPIHGMCDDVPGVWLDMAHPVDGGFFDCSPPPSPTAQAQLAMDDDDVELLDPTPPTDVVGPGRRGHHARPHGQAAHDHDLLQPRLRRSSLLDVVGPGRRGHHAWPHGQAAHEAAQPTAHDHQAAQGHDVDPAAHDHHAAHDHDLDRRVKPKSTDGLYNNYTMARLLVLKRAWHDTIWALAAAQGRAPQPSQGASSWHQSIIQELQSHDTAWYDTIWALAAAQGRAPKT